MRFIAFITDSQQTRKILEHIGESTIRPLPLTKPNVSAAAEVALEQIDYLPSVDSYVIDPIYPD